jgi:hypothetical protein
VGALTEQEEGEASKTATVDLRGLRQWLLMAPPETQDITASKRRKSQTIWRAAAMLG